MPGGTLSAWLRSVADFQTQTCALSHRFVSNWWLSDRLFDLPSIWFPAAPKMKSIKLCDTNARRGKVDRTGHFALEASKRLGDMVLIRWVPSDTFLLSNTPSLIWAPNCVRESNSRYKIEQRNTNRPEITFTESLDRKKADPFHIMGYLNDFRHFGVLHTSSKYPNQRIISFLEVVANQKSLWETTCDLECVQNSFPNAQ